MGRNRNDQEEEATFPQETNELVNEAAPEAEADNTGLVKMRKGDQTLYVHPTAVKDHLTAGWTHA